MRWLLASLLLLAARMALGQAGVMATKHNLSASGPGPIKSEVESQVCVFCHVPHGGRGLGNNRPLSATSYQPYASSTLVSQPPDRPSGSTRICLSCHDGTIAVGRTLASGQIPVQGTDPTGRLSLGRSNLGTDLRKSHPVSFVPATSPRFRAPPASDPVKLDGQGRLECISCHDPHSNEGAPVDGKFLVKPNRASTLCLTCHVEPAWTSNPSVHQASTATYDGPLGATTPYKTVADNACSACHTSHGAATTARLLKDGPSKVCMQCHSGKVAQRDLSADFAKPYSHPALGHEPSSHDAAEGPGNELDALPETRATARRHVECVDCHNPHAVYSNGASRRRLPGSARSRPESGLVLEGDPLAQGARLSRSFAGVWGIDRNGSKVDQAQYEYEVCFKCHADSANRPLRGPSRSQGGLRRPSSNLRLATDLGAVSYHPIQGPGRNPGVPGLIGLTETSVIYCTDCHNSDTGPGNGGDGPAGPHGSSFPYLLERNLATDDFTPESEEAYALCYKCHDRGVLYSESSGFPHLAHVQRARTPCTVCHDSHGVSALEGNPASNAHLINFDLTIVQPSSGGQLNYTSMGPRRGMCSMRCHFVEHKGTMY
ncbi:MAG: hypothetical protein HYZ28_12645 [Myxococcales bacterium]|nr:hypothetical protein [Myxococcales bacterium]